MPLDKLNTCWEALVEALSAVLETIPQLILIIDPQVAQGTILKPCGPILDIFGTFLHFWEIY